MQGLRAYDLTLRTKMNDCVTFLGQAQAFKHPGWLMWLPTVLTVCTPEEELKMNYLSQLWVYAPGIHGED